MNVFRVENTARQGPYRGGGGISYAGSTHRPAPCDDGLDWCDGMHFGFHSLGSLQRWFNDRDEHSIMASVGFHVAIYNVPEEQVTLGNCQLIFSKEHSELLLKLDLTTIFP